MKNITHEELGKLIWEKVKAKYDEIDEKYDDSAMSVIPTTTAQVAVYATLQVLEELGLLTLPKKQD